MDCRNTSSTSKNLVYVLAFDICICDFISEENIPKNSRFSLHVCVLNYTCMYIYGCVRVCVLLVQQEIPTDLFLFLLASCERKKNSLHTFYVV